MIDTDKYEGHTRGPWNLTSEGHIVADDMTVVCNKHTKRIVETNHKDTQLIADAPLLLEEVKRLRKDRDLLWDAIRLSGTGGNQEEEIAFWHEKLLNMNEAELKEAFKGHYEEGDD